MAEFTLDPKVAAKYDIVHSFLGGQKLVFPNSAKHGVAHKPAHLLTVEEVDKLVAAKAVNGIFTLKVAAPSGDDHQE